MTATMRTGTPIPRPTPSPIFFPVSEWEAGAAAVGVELEADEESVIEDVAVDAEVVDDVLGLVLVLETDTPIVAARKIRLSMAQHFSEVNPSPQHHLPSVAHCIINTLSSGFPPDCFRQLSSTHAENLFRSERTEVFVQAC